MPREAAVKNYVTFVQGLVTEANPLAFPENASFDEENFELYRDGSRRRRLGIDYEESYSFITDILSDTFIDKAVSVQKWTSVNGITTFNVLAVQFGRYIHFFDYSNNTLSATEHDWVIDLNEYAAPLITDVGKVPVHMTSGNGKLYITSTEITPIYLTLTEGENGDIVIDGSEVSILFRDLEGVEDGLAPNTRPSTLSGDHEYNLINQGWDDAKIASYVATSPFVYPSNSDIWFLGKDATTGLFSPTEMNKQEFGNTLAPKGRNIIDLFNQKREAGDKFLYYDVSTITQLGGSYKGKAYLTGFSITTTSAHGLAEGEEIFISDVQGGQIQRTGGDAKYSANYLLNGKYFKVTNVTPTTFTVSIPWMRSYALVTPFTINTGKIRKVDNLYTVDTYVVNARPATVAFWGGRVWYAGIADEKYSSSIFFSQIIESDSNIGKCYQVADPTSEHDSDLVATDGGQVPIPEIGAVNRLVPISDSMIIFADNGVWQIRGGESDVFKATDYYVRKLTDVGTSSPESIVQVEGTVFYWAHGGIYTLVSDKITGNLAAQNLTEQTIQSLYNGISPSAKIYAKGVYDDSQKKIYWTYNSDSAFNGVSFLNQYDTVLVLDLSLGAFYKHVIKDITTNTPFIVAPVVTAKSTQAERAVTVVVGIDVVQVAGDNVTVDERYAAAGDSKIKFLVAQDQLDNLYYRATFAEFGNKSFLDWYTADSTGIDAKAFVDTGFETFGDIIRDKQIDKLFCFFRKTETGFIDDGSGNLIYENPSSCLVSCKFNWTDNSNGNKWTATEEAYKLPRNYIPSGVGDPFTDGTYIVRGKPRIRGIGQAVQFRFETQAGKDCWLLGWAAQASMEQVP